MYYDEQWIEKSLAQLDAENGKPPWPFSETEDSSEEDEMRAQDQQAQFATAPWTDAISDDCTGCKWVNYSDNGGWYLKSRSSQCPVHGDGQEG